MKKVMQYKDYLQREMLSGHMNQKDVSILERQHFNRGKDRNGAKKAVRPYRGHSDMTVIAQVQYEGGYAEQNDVDPVD